jgi:ribosomal protein S18 acetylase RimI-like enzyme
VRTDSVVRAQLERYYDAVPRLSARVEHIGPLSLFISDSGAQAYYGRPTLGHRDAITADAVRVVVERQRRLGLPQSLEWVAETTPSLEAATLAVGLEVSRHPLMVFESTRGAAPDVTANARVLEPDDPALATAIAAAHLAFSEPGTAVGATGRAELADKAAELRIDGWLAALAQRMRVGQAVVAAAFESGDEPDAAAVAVASGQHNPVDATTEIVGIGTLPTARRRGHAQAVTRALVQHARSTGIETIFLSAGDDDVARIYERIGFRRIGTALVADGSTSS